MPATKSTATFWMEQCEAAEYYIRPRFGLTTALDYLVGEKFINYLDGPNFYPDWRNDLPKFAVEIRRRFKRRELHDYFEEAMRGRGLGGHLKTGHTWSLQNRPTKLTQDKSIYNSTMVVLANIFRNRV